jgi:hypothetical protein
MLKAQAKGPEPPQEFERLVRPHVASFDFFLQDGMRQAVQLLEPLEVRLEAGQGSVPAVVRALHSRGSSSAGAAALCFCCMVLKCAESFYTALWLHSVVIRLSACYCSCWPAKHK